MFTGARGHGASGGGVDGVQLSDILLYTSSGRLLAIYDDVINATNPGRDASSNSLQPAWPNSVDGDHTTVWQDLSLRQTMGQSVLRISLRRPEQVVMYELISSRATMKRDPTSWILGTVRYPLPYKSAKDGLTLRVPVATR